MEYAIRRARTSDVRAIGGLVDDNVDSGRLLAKATVTLYEDVQEFWIAERAGDGEVIGCGLFTSCGRTWLRSGPSRSARIAREKGVGHRLVEALLGSSRELGVRRVFVLTFAVGFFAGHGFKPIDGSPVSHEVYEELLRSYDEGVAEFLDIDRVQAQHPRQYPHAAAPVITCGRGSQQAQLPVGRTARPGRGRAGEASLGRSRPGRVTGRPRSPRRAGAAWRRWSGTDASARGSCHEQQAPLFGRVRARPGRRALAIG